MKNQTTRYSSANGEVWAMATFKVKYCKKVFNIPSVRKECSKFLIEALNYNKIKFGNIGFDEDHVHILLDMGLLSKPEIAKRLKGSVGRKILTNLKWLKQKMFWGSGFWSPSYDVRSHEFDVLSRYIDK